MKRVEIYLTGGFAIQLDESFEAVLSVLDNRDIGPDEYLYSQLADGSRTAYLKKDIVGMCEYDETETKL